MTLSWLLRWRLRPAESTWWWLNHPAQRMDWKSVLREYIFILLYRIDTKISIPFHKILLVLLYIIHEEIIIFMMTWWDNWKNCSVSHDSNCEISGYKYNDVSCTLEYKPLLQKPKIFRRYFYRLETLFIFTKPWTINYKVGTIKVKIRGDNVKLKIKLSHGDNDPDPSRCSDHCSKTAKLNLT